MPPTAAATRILLIACLAAAAPAQALTVTSITPADQSRAVSPASPVTIVFSAPVDPLTVTPQTVRLAGRWSGPVPGVLALSGGGTVVTFTPFRAMFATEIATLQVARSVRSTTGAQLVGGHAAQWWVAAARSTGTFVLDHVVDYRRPGEGLVRTYGFFAGDVDRDGAPDMSATNEVSFDIRLMKNDGCGHFGAPLITALPAGHEPSPNDGADFDGDGWIDLATGNQTAGSVAVFLNDRAGNYRAPLVIPVGGQAHGLALLDAEGDGDVDIAACNQSDIALLRNNGNGTFAPPVFFDGGGAGEWSLAAADANHDGRLDLFCGTSQSQLVTVLLADGNGGFTPAGSRPAGGFPWQMATGDLDGDGNVDCIVANNGTSTAGVLRGDGNGGLLPVVTYPVGSAPVSVDVGDIEGDGDLDVVVASFNAGTATVLRNNGAGVLGNRSTLPASSAGSCAVIVDYDRDGDTDVILVDELDDKGFVWRQDGPVVAGAQAPTCDAALRVNAFADRAGYGTRPPLPLPGGQIAFLDVSGRPGQPFALLFGSALAAGLPSPFGLVNLDLAQPLFAPFNGFAGNPIAVLDGFGEARLLLPVPPGLPPGSTIAVQGLVAAGAALAATNPVRVAF